MTPSPTLHVVEGGDHSFKVTGAGRAGQAAIEARLHDVVETWIRGLIG
jgi:hypothetical protein